ncbi:hypothetical protein IC582_016553 [Cucumis melo]
MVVKGLQQSKSQSRATKTTNNLVCPKLFLYLLSISALLSILFHIHSLHHHVLPPPPSSIVAKLRRSVTFLPLKDLRYSNKALVGHTWFMSSLYDIQEEGEVQYQQFPSPVVDGDERMLCLKGRDTHDGSWNYYGLAWPEGLPENATVMKGVSFVSYNHYDYQNIWHGLSALMPFVAWHQIQGKCEVPERWILYHWGELRLRMGKWVNTLMEATFGAPIRIEAFEGISEGQPVCFEKAVVMRHNEGGMSRQRRMETYDFMRCKARLLCNLTSPEPLSGAVGMTMLMRTGPRSFRNETTVAEIFGKECAKVAGCRLTVAYSNNLTFCEQVSLMGKTDILISPHGAQLTNMILMNRNSSVMEFFPKGWLELAGIGQYVYHWLASWSGMKHQGAWRDPNSTLPCPYSPNDRRCMSFYKGGTIGYNRTYFSEWAKSVLNEVKMRKIEEATKFTTNQVHECSCI